MTLEPLAPPPDLTDLAAFSAQIGSNPLLIQGAGGNTSVKDGEVMWIKASGTLLAEAQTKDIFVPVDLPAMQAALNDPAIDADQPAQFALGGATLRPSIETSLHAMFRQRVVIHVHCVNTLAHAVRSDAEVLLGQKLTGFDWRLVPYVKPGANLARAVTDAMGPETDVVVLRNHGLIVAANSVDEAARLLERVVAALDMPEDRSFKPRLDTLKELANAHWNVPDADDVLHQLAHPERAKKAARGTLYPDHVIFCGIGALCLSEDILPDPEGAPPFAIFPGRGVMVRTERSHGAEALSRCLADVMVRVPDAASLTYFSDQENAELLDWDAEKYRLKLNV